MQFPIAIHKYEGSVYGVTVPDIPGVHSWGDTVDEAIRNTREAIAGHLQTLAALGEDVDVTCSTIEDLTKQDEYAGAIWAFVEIDDEELDRTPERINVSLPASCSESWIGLPRSGMKHAAGFWLARPWS